MTATAHAIYAASVRQFAGLELERQGHLEQIAGLVAERDALRDQLARLNDWLAEHEPNLYRADEDTATAIINVLRRYAYSVEEWRNSVENVRYILGGGARDGEYMQASNAALCFCVGLLDGEADAPEAPRVTGVL